MSTLQFYGNPQQVLAVVTPVYEAVEVADNGFCPHDDCHPSLGVEWHGKDGFIGSDCIEDDDGNAFCIKSDKLVWNGTNIIFTGQFLYVKVKS